MIDWLLTRRKPFCRGLLTTRINLHWSSSLPKYITKRFSQLSYPPSPATPWFGLVYKQPAQSKLVLLRQAAQHFRAFLYYCPISPALRLSHTVRFVWCINTHLCWWDPSKESSLVENSGCLIASSLWNGELVLEQFNFETHALDWQYNRQNSSSLITSGLNDQAS